MGTWILLISYWSISTNRMIDVRKTYTTQESCMAAREKILAPELRSSSAMPRAECFDNGDDFTKKLQEIADSAK